ncbi:non-ribosomal peptide synthetase [Variovorax sp. WS11]|nr:non-ribosomal peptide synthetase [Variovorax sp. WS11]
MPQPSREYPLDFVAHLRALASTRPGDRALIVVRSEAGSTIDVPIDYRSLDQRVRALAARLQQDFAPGDRALIMLDNDEHYVVSFLACLYAGLIAVPVFPPESTRRQHLDRLSGIAADAQARCILTNAAIEALVQSAGDAFAGAAVLAVDTVGTEGTERWTPHTPAAADIAFLQYTSGSTSAPKGVMVLHGNLMANMRAIEEGLSVGPQDVFANWLPLNHDMGLIGGLLQPIHRGIPVVLMSPRFFLERPIRWLEAIARHRATVSGGPDFAFRLCLERVKPAQVEQLDLSSWTLAFSGAEPVRADTLEAFKEHFAAARFCAQAIYPCYGLAEATLFVTGGRRGAGMVAHRFSAAQIAQRAATPSEQEEDGVMLVGCGAPVSAHTLQIVDPESLAVLESGRIGEIWASGPSIGAGYWKKPQESARTFVERDGRRWLRTGDLGFVFHGQLHVAGRIKDMIIVRGHNLYPQDLERAVEAEVDAVRKGRVAAFAVAGPEGEGIGLAAEVSRSMQKLVDPAVLVEALGAAVSELCGEPLSVVVLLNPGGLPKTTSGKLQRSACRAGWLDGSIDAYAIHAHGRFTRGGSAAAPAAPALDDTESALAALWGEVLRRAPNGPLGPQAHFFALGGNSLDAVQAAARIAARWHIAFEPRHLFEQPRLGACAAEIRRLLAAGARSALIHIPALAPAQRAQPLPLSHAQQRQWFLWCLNPSSAAYHIGGQLRLAGALDEPALRAALDALVQRHEILRTVFRPAPDGTARQHIQAALPPRWSSVDVSASPDDAREALAAQAIAQVQAEPFDLGQGPLVRAVLVRLAPQLHRLAIVFHHIVADGVSMQVVVEELGSLYRALAQGETPSLPALPLQYADYAAWHGEWLASGERHRQLAHWTRQLGTEHPVLALPADRPRASIAEHRAARHQAALPPTLVTALRQLAEAQGTTLFTVLLAGLQVLLHRCTGQEDVRVGVPIANRQRGDTAGLVGFFVNTQVLRNTVHGRAPLARVLAQARAAALDALSHPDLPFEHLVEALAPERSLAHSPLFQVLFNHLREDYRAASVFSGLEVAVEPLDGPAAQFELSVEVGECPDGRVALRLVYAAELFDALTMERFSQRYERVLEAMAAQPALAAGDIDLLLPGERADIEAWSRGSRDAASAEPVHRHFEAQVRRTPEAIALRFGTVALSYDALNRRANRLAHRLMAQGVGIETRVGIAAERSVEMVVGLLGILKAGGAYVPLDPDLPAERLVHMLDDSGIGLLLTQAHLRERLPAREAVRVLALDEALQDEGAEHDPAVALDGENLVYVIYTSGSTGRPKGAANRHRALTNRLAWGQRHQPLSAEDVVLQKTPFSFDISFWEFFWPLSVGATLALAAPHDHRDPARLVALIAQYRITTIHFVPSMLQAFLAHEGARSCTGLRRIVCSGEALSAELQARVFETLPRVTLHNLYGPTEAAIEVSAWDCRDEGALTVPIGRPIANLDLHVLDADLHRVPRGVAGELHLGGEGLARGYWDRAALTAERFVASPFGDGGRLYRSGDLVRWRADGQIEYLGRVDHQVKIRGFRIELGEVEARLLDQPGVREAVVVAQEDAQGARLVAYVAGEALAADALRRQLGAVLPDYMVPSVVMLLDRLPLNTNGKVDRKALPAPAAARQQPYEAPRGQVAETIAGLWSEVLGGAQVGLHDNFFDIGGHSLQLIRAHRLLEERLQAGLSVIDLFKHPTVAALAARIAQGEAAPAPARQDDEERARRQRAALMQRRPAPAKVG